MFDRFQNTSLNTPELLKLFVLLCVVIVNFEHICLTILARYAQKGQDF